MAGTATLPIPAKLVLPSVAKTGSPFQYPFADQTRAQVTWDPNMVSSWRIVGYENRITSDESFTQARREFAEIPAGACHHRLL